MATITHPALVDTRKVAKAIKDWLDLKGFEIKALEASGAFTVKARKSSTIRAIVAADRALEIDVHHSGGQTVVDVRQGSWKTNVISNVVWAVATGGMNLAFSGWSLVIQKELESYIRSVFAELGGVHEVDLTTGASVPPVIGASIRPDPVAPDAREKRSADISFYCYKCGQGIVIDTAGAGLQVKCPKCHAELTVPTAQSHSPKGRTG